ncbi:MAG: hypothetical protein KAV99_04930 [Candidatus Latescibacteria bacterium]|nr:hypothetical protein [Candidatus Latescibacterota bacterium]
MTNPKQRVLTALAHREPDRVPLDWWAVPETVTSAMKTLGLNSQEELLQGLEIDLRYVKPRYAGDDYIEQPDGSLHKKLPEGTFVDIWSVQRKEIDWGKGSYLEVVRSPLAQAETPGDIEQHPWPDVEKFDYHSVVEQCEEYRDFGVVCTGDRLATRASVFKLAMYLRGMDRLLMDLALNPKLVDALVHKLLEFHLEHNQRIFECSAEGIDIFMLGDDFGSENGPLISPEMFRRFFKPALKELIALGKRYGLRVMLHSCGSVRELIPDLIDIGLDILNPIQTHARGMVPEELKREFGKDLCFHGSIDVQHTLPFGTPEEVKSEVKARIQTLGKGGSFILAPAHNLQPDVSIQNILTMYRTAVEI